MGSSRAKALATKGSNIQSSRPVKMAGTDGCLCCCSLQLLLRTQAFTGQAPGNQSPEAVSLLPEHRQLDGSGI